MSDPIDNKILINTDYGYGYITLPDKQGEDDKITVINVQFNWGGIGYLHTTCLRKKVKLRIKTLYGDRKTHNIEVDINEPIENIKDIVSQISEEDKSEVNSFHIYRFIYSQGGVKDLDTKKTIAEHNIPNNALLLFVGVNKFYWDSVKRGSNII